MEVLEFSGKSSIPDLLRISHTAKVCLNQRISLTAYRQYNKPIEEHISLRQISSPGAENADKAHR